MTCAIEPLGFYQVLALDKEGSKLDMATSLDVG